ncbi:hypothetical protein [Myxococcus sp. AM010]|nr:hypothetical protein [Myxococcus sp. AM010]
MVGGARGWRLAQLRLPTVLVREGGCAVEELGINVSDVPGGFDAGR